MPQLHCESFEDGGSSSFYSILYKSDEDCTGKETAQSEPLYVDLNLDKVIHAIIKGRNSNLLASLFYTPLRDSDTVMYRQEVFRDLENKKLLTAVTTFSEKMDVMRRYLHLSDTLQYAYHKKGWFLEAAHVYCRAVVELSDALSALDVKSRGFISLREYVTVYTDSDAFQQLLGETEGLKEKLSGVKYCILLKRNSCSVSRYENEINYSEEVEKIFEKFKQGVERDYSIKLQQGTGMNYVEAKILERVVRLYPQIFLDLDTFVSGHTGFLDAKVDSFDREVQFYVSYLDYISVVQQAELRFCYPEVSSVDKTVYAVETFDLALARTLIAKDVPVISNNFYLEGGERIIVVSGPNQGGKTTFARTFGQLHYLARLGCPVPGKSARLFLPDRIFTHFEKQENIKNLRGKLQDDLIRMNKIINTASSNSIIILNEIFTSTTLQDGLFLSKEIMKRIVQLDALCVVVTFMDELSTSSNKTVSMVSTVIPENPALRTYKIVRKPADGLAYAQSLAEKYRLTYGLLKERINS